MLAMLVGALLVLYSLFIVGTDCVHSCFPVFQTVRDKRGQMNLSGGLASCDFMFVDRGKVSLGSAVCGIWK